MSENSNPDDPAQAVAGSGDTIDAVDTTDAHFEVAVKDAQYISRHCFVCGTENCHGLHSRFFTLADGRAASIFTASNQHQGYPGRIHGGIISAVLDELIGRVMQATDPTAFAVTVELSVRFKKPAPLMTELKAIAWQTRDSTRIFEGQAELYLPDGSVAVTASGKYLKMAVDRIVDPNDFSESDWVVDTHAKPESILF